MLDFIMRLRPAGSKKIRMPVKRLLFRPVRDSMP
jgi:hypothetical protein